MASLMDELDSTISQTNQEVEKLQQLDPSNELLKWWVLMPDENKNPRFKSEEDRLILMKGKFWRRDVPWREEDHLTVVVATNINYLFAIKKRIERIELAQRLKKKKAGK